jgi:rhamnulokinase
MSTTHHIAIDLGASNARIIVGRLGDDGVALREVARFEHHPLERAGRLVWDWERIRSLIRAGLGEAAQAGSVASVSCDAWAQDFGLLDEGGRLLGPPVSYRDTRTAGLPGGFADAIAPDDLVRRLGSVASPITTLCQLRAPALQEPSDLARAATLLHIADLIHYDLAGVVATDRTLATASQLCRLSTGEWDCELLERLSIPCAILPPIVSAPTPLGAITGVPEIVGAPLVVSAGHDTAAAAAFMPGLDEGVAFLMSGTWSMLGVATDAPVLTERPALDGLALLGLPHGRWGLFRPLMGLWILQECRRAWAEQGRRLTHEQLIEAAERSTCAGLLDPESARFASPADMPLEVRRFCEESGQPAPKGPGDVARVVLSGLAANHALAVRSLQQATGLSIRELRMVGGGSANPLLCRLTADALGLPVIAGPVEASALGNVLLQAQAVGALATSPQVLRQAAEASVEFRRYEPGASADIRAAERLCELRERFVEDRL